MSKRCWLWAAITLVVATYLVQARAKAQESAAPAGVWDAARLKQAIADIGYEPKALNTTQDKEKYEFKVERGGLTVPVGSELSGSKNYLWLSVYLKDAPKDFAAHGEKLGNLLKANSKVQPAQFYITEKGALMIAVAMENRAMTNAILRRNVERLVNDVVEQKAAWQF